jgi:Ran GTPase-activating protein (RanGAP) involved in mRNA processing and transport
MMLRKPDIHLQKTEIRSQSLTLLLISNSKWIKHLNVKPENLKPLLQERIGKTLGHIGIGNNFLNKTPMVQQLRERTDK